MIDNDVPSTQNHSTALAIVGLESDPTDLQMMHIQALIVTFLLMAKLDSNAFSPRQASPRVRLADSMGCVVRNAVASADEPHPIASDPGAPVFQSTQTSRRQHLQRFVAPCLVGLTSSLFWGPPVARADVSDGNQLPQGAAQFARVIRLSSDLKAVRTRASEHGGEIDDKEWDNIGKFLRTAYSIADQDMKGVAAGIFNPDNKKRALSDADQLKTYAQAGDVPVNKKDAAKLVPVLDKMSGLVSDFLESLSDVPDEI